jgi:hypothetical protein
MLRRIINAYFDTIGSVIGDEIRPHHVANFMYRANSALSGVANTMAKTNTHGPNVRPGNIQIPLTANGRMTTTQGAPTRGGGL